jgi:hypothetical protein
MAIIRVGKHVAIREYLKVLVTPLKSSGVLSTIYKSDQEITNDNNLPSVCLFMEEGFTETESLDQSLEELTTADVVIKVKAAVKSQLNGDDYLDSIADKVSELLNQDLTLGGILESEMSCESFEYLRDPNKIYTCIIFRATIQFYDK